MRIIKILVTAWLAFAAAWGIDALVYHYQLGLVVGYVNFASNTLAPLLGLPPGYDSVMCVTIPLLLPIVAVAFAFILRGAGAGGVRLESHNPVRAESTFYSKVLTPFALAGLLFGLGAMGVSYYLHGYNINDLPWAGIAAVSLLILFFSPDAKPA